eukprot:176679-Amphidinium_carterae.1
MRLQRAFCTSWRTRNRAQVLGHVHPQRSEFFHVGKFASDKGKQSRNHGKHMDTAPSATTNTKEE